MLGEYRDFAVSLASDCGKIIKKNYGKVKNQDWNTLTHFKTEVDDKSDKLIRSRIKESFPFHNIYSEEGAGLDRRSDYSWVCDSLDGTIPYTLGINDFYSVSIGLVKGRRPILGIINAVGRKEFYVGEEGKGAFCNEERIKVSLEENVNHVVMGLDSGKETKSFKRSSLAPFISRAMSPDGINCFLCAGAAAVPLCLAASGRLHAYLALSLEPWDMAAGVVINREAGAKVTNLEGREWQLGDESVLAANPLLHGKIMELFKY